MRWTPGDRSNVEDMRGRRGGAVLPLGIGGFVVLLLLSWATGTDFLSLFTQEAAPSQRVGTTASPGAAATTPAEERRVDFVDAVTNDVQDTWAQLLGARYERTRVVLFRDAIQSACGSADEATGPFYCPGDHKVYLDLGFFDDLSQRFGAPGEFAQAYVIAHELGHHVQNLLGIDGGSGGRPRTGANGASVALELQADCFAGVWANHAQERTKFLDPGDIDAALQTASAIGDDTLQRKSQGQVVPDSFTHGSAEQRKRWFSTGFQQGTTKACNTFAAANRL
jgi:uncharacterized protein